VTVSTVDELRTGGTVLPITRWGNPVMHARTRPVVRFDRELHELVLNTPDVQAMPQKLIDMANERGGDDNITVIVVKVQA